MIKFFLILCFWVSCVVGFEPPQILLQKASSQEVSEIQQKMTTFYGQNLFEAGVFKDKESALQAALDECSTADVNEVVYYFNLVSKPATKCGYFVYSTNNNIAHLDAIYLDEAYRGQGLAKQVLQSFEVELMEKNIDTVLLYVFAHNQIAIKLYEKMGYTIEASYLPIGHQMKKQLQNSLLDALN